MLNILREKLFKYMDVIKIRKDNRHILVNKSVSIFERIFRFNCSQAIYFIILFTIMIGIALAIGKALGVDVGGFASDSKFKLVVMLIYYLLVQLGMIGLMCLRTISKAIKKEWVIFVFGNFLFLCITLYIESIQSFKQMVMILGGFNALVFLHSINISDEFIKKYIKLMIRLFYLVVAVAIIQKCFLLIGINIVIHTPRINSIFTDYNGFSGYLLSLIPLLWVLKKQKLIVISLILLWLSGSTTSIFILLTFLIMIGIKKMKKRKFFIKGIVVFIILTVSLLLSIKYYTVDKFDDHPTNPIFKMRQMIDLMSLKKIKLIKDNMQMIDFGTAKAIIGLDKSSAVDRGIQFVIAFLGWESIGEIIFGLRKGAVEGTFLTIFIRYGLVGFAFYFYFYHKYFIFNTKNSMFKYYFWAFFIGVAIGLPLFSYPISMYIMSLQIYVFQRLLINPELKKNFIKDEKRLI